MLSIMEELSAKKKRTNNDDLPLVHGCNKRNQSDSTEEKFPKKVEAEVLEDDESSELLDPESTKNSTDAQSIALRLFWKRIMEFYMKFILLVISTICAGLHGQWAGPVTKNFITVFPFSAFCGFSAMLVYIILIYRWWHRMSKHMRMATILFCGTVFCAVGVMELYYLNTHSFTSDGSMYELEYTEENKPITKYYKRVSEGTISSVAFLSFTLTALCLIDAFLLIQ
ncbi:hypothetical protein J437_LFUL001241 [Ladona fulva]|uniref:Uncharacterized protein n=1 Tax=Ladona fulva TaxID=123851 RepID=A0A8K0JZX5_LADFU|nr:hypothetical protein J437_LFUL001241 [Ladona fulva]